MDTVIGNLPNSKVKTEDNLDCIVDLEARPDCIDTIEKWHDQICKRIHQATQENERRVEDMMLAYYRLLKEKILNNKDKSLLKGKILLHVRHFYLYYKAIGHAIVDTNYFTRMEEILTYYCNLELELVYNLSKQRENKKYFLFVIRRLCKVLGIYLHHKLRYIIHVLLKMKYNTHNSTCQMVMKQVYSHFLTRLPTEPFSDEVFCRYYLAFERYKEVARPEEKEKLGQFIFIKFGKTRDFLNRSPIMRTVLSPTCSSLPDAITHLLDFRTRAIDSYFTYLKNQENEVARLVSDFDARSSPINFGNLHIDLFDNCPSSEPLCIDSDSDIEAIEEEGTIVLSDEDGIEIIYRERDIRTKHKTKKKNDVDVINLDSDEEQDIVDKTVPYPASTTPMSTSAATMCSENTSMSTSASVVTTPVPTPSPAASDHIGLSRLTETPVSLDMATPIESPSKTVTSVSPETRLPSSPAHIWSVFRSTLQSQHTENPKPFASLSSCIKTPPLFSTMTCRQNKGEDINLSVEKTVVSLLKLSLNEEVCSGQLSIDKAKQELLTSKSEQFRKECKNFVEYTKLLSKQNAITAKTAVLSVITTATLDRKAKDQSVSSNIDEYSLYAEKQQRVSDIKPVKQFGSDRISLTDMSIDVPVKATISVLKKHETLTAGDKSTTLNSSSKQLSIGLEPTPTINPDVKPGLAATIISNIEDFVTDRIESVVLINPASAQERMAGIKLCREEQPVENELATVDSEKELLSKPALAENKCTNMFSAETLPLPTISDMESSTNVTTITSLAPLSSPNIPSNSQSVLSISQCTTPLQEITHDPSSKSQYGSDTIPVTDMSINVPVKATVSVLTKNETLTAGDKSTTLNSSSMISSPQTSDFESESPVTPLHLIREGEITISNALYEQPLETLEKVALSQDGISNSVLVPMLDSQEHSSGSSERELDTEIILNSSKYKSHHSTSGCDSGCVICRFECPKQRDSPRLEKLKTTSEPVYEFGIITPPTDSRFDQNLPDLEDSEDIFDEHDDIEKGTMSDGKCSLSNYFDTDNQNEYSNVDLITKSSCLGNSRLKNVIIEHVETIYDNMSLQFSEMDGADNISNDAMTEQIDDYTTSEQNDVANTSELDIKDTIIQVVPPSTSSLSPIDFEDHDNIEEENGYKTNGNGIEESEHERDYSVFIGITSSSVGSSKRDLIDDSKHKHKKRSKSKVGGRKKKSKREYLTDSNENESNNKSQKILFTSEAFKLNNFSKLNCDNELDDVLSGPIGDVNSQYYENSDGNFNLFGYADSVPPLLLVKTDKSKEIDSPAYNKMDSDDFKNYIRHEFSYNSAFKLSESGSINNNDGYVTGKSKVTFNDIVDTHFIMPTYVKSKSRKRKYKPTVRDGIKCYIDPNDEKLNAMPKLVIHKISDNDLLNKYKVVNHNTLRTCIRKKIDCNLEVNSGSTVNKSLKGPPCYDDLHVNIKETYVQGHRIVNGYVPTPRRRGRPRKRQWEEDFVSKKRRR